MTSIHNIPIKSPRAFDFRQVTPYIFAMYRSYLQFAMKGFVLPCAIALLSACQASKPQIMLEDYASRMSKVLEVNIELSLADTALTLPNFPDKRDRRLPTQSLREGLWDVLDFRQCDMLALIAERNSSLGKVMPPSQKMRYEFRLMHALEQCQATLAAIEEPDDTQKAFKERLTVIYNVKRSNLPAEVWNGLYSADEISQHFSIGTSPLDMDGQSSVALQQVLQQFAELAKQSLQPPITLPNWLNDVEAPYEVLYRSEFGAQLLSSIVMVTQTLNLTAQAIETRLAIKPFCFTGHQPPRATVLNNIFQKYYAGKVQPYMALIQRQGLPWFRLHNRLIDQLPSTQGMKSYQQQVLALDQPDSVWGQWLAASARHTQAWQDILGQCNMMPKRETASPTS